jgi:hypothetical protein
MPAPAPASSFVGRAGELGDLAALLARERLTRAAAARALGEGDPAEAAHAALAEAAELGLRPVVLVAPRAAAPASARGCRPGERPRAA